MSAHAVVNQRPAATAPAIGVVTDAFTKVVGNRRGSGRPDDTPVAGLSPVARALELVRRVNGIAFPVIADSIAAELDAAAELGLELAHGRWADDPANDYGQCDCMALTGVYEDDALLGFIGGAPDGRGVAFYQARSDSFGC